MDHGGNRNPDPGLLKVIDGQKGLFESASSSERFMALFQSVEAYLNFMDAKPPGDFFCNQCAIGEKDRSKGMTSEDIVDLPELRVKQRFPAGNKKPEPLDLFEIV